MAMLIISAIGRPKLEDQGSCAIQRDPGFIKTMKKGERRTKRREEGNKCENRLRGRKKKQSKRGEEEKMIDLASNSKE